MKKVIGKTRKYSSRMHTARLLNGKGCCREGGGGCIVGEAVKVVLSGGGAVQGCHPSGCHPGMGGVLVDGRCPRGRGVGVQGGGVVSEVSRGGGVVHNRK